jgi:hypothetical protein
MSFTLVRTPFVSVLIMLSSFVCTSAIAELRLQRKSDCEHTETQKSSLNHRNEEARQSRSSGETERGEVGLGGFGQGGEILPNEEICTTEETCKTPCEELEEAMNEAGAENPYGAVGCYDGEVLICVYEENFSHEDDDDVGAAIVRSCIQEHENTHGHQCECDEDAEGLQTPENDLQSSKNEGAALSAEIDCYEGSDCSGSSDPVNCQAVVEEFKKEACDQYQTNTGKKHTSC